LQLPGLIEKRFYQSLNGNTWDGERLWWSTDLASFPCH